MLLGFIGTILFGCARENVDYIIEFYKDSTIKSQGFYLKNKRHGPFSSYDKNGMKTAEGLYTNGKRNGTWQYYDMKGLYKTVQFCNGKISKISNYSNGGINSILRVQNNESINEIIYFYKDNQIIDSTWYPTPPYYINIVEEN